ncbi:MAG: ROK family protein [Rhizobiales bacterium]|nr:ROK family protein [Hyphomicrobiales bacterium]
MHGAIDLGGTKIEAALLDENLVPIRRHRIVTPNLDYDDLLAAIGVQINWLREQSSDGELSIGIGVPGIVNKNTGMTLTSNLPTAGHTFRKDISKIAGYDVPLENDCRCFALSEANGGAGENFNKVFGLIVGTGIGGGICNNGVLTAGLNSLPVEVAHIPLPATIVKKYNLPLNSCGCGRTGCYETLVSGPGFSKLAKHMVGVDISVENIVSRANLGDLDMQRVMAVWIELYAHMLDMIQLMNDPDCIILGGGTSLIDGLIPKLSEAMQKIALKNTLGPELLLAKFGDSSGVRGAAMLPLEKLMKNR